MCRFEDREGGVKRPSQWSSSIKASICALFHEGGCVEHHGGVVEFKGNRGGGCGGGGIKKKKAAPATRTAAN